mgnify:FL=1
MSVESAPSQLRIPFSIRPSHGIVPREVSPARWCDPKSSLDGLLWPASLTPIACCVLAIHGLRDYYTLGRCITCNLLFIVVTLLHPRSAAERGEKKSCEIGGILLYMNFSHCNTPSVHDSWKIFFVELFSIQNVQCLKSYSSFLYYFGSFQCGLSILKISNLSLTAHSQWT